jgi:hypothetical protein
MATRGVRYGDDIERSMRALFESLSERDRRLYAATEADKLGHGGVASLASVLGCSERTIRRGALELGRLPQPPDGRVRKKGAAASVSSIRSPASTPTSSPCFATTPRATRRARA